MLHKQKFIREFIGLSDIERDDIKNLVDTFNFFNFDLYLVGGCVRDFVLQREPSDIDFCTNATPDIIKEVFKSLSFLSPWSIIDTGTKHGTVTLYNRKNGTAYEVTTYRQDGKYTDNRRPDSVEFVTTLEDDLKRRDFTINSLAYDYINEELIMLDESFLMDLELRIIRTVGDATERFNEDALRMLRAIRFSAQLNSTIETNTFKAIQKLAENIVKISSERIRDELVKIITSDNPQQLKLLMTAELADYIMPDLLCMYNVEQKNLYHYTDALHHTLDVIKALPKDDVVLRLSALFHDMGKSHTSSWDELGNEHHYNHEHYSALIAERYMKDLKFDSKTINDVVTIVSNHGYQLVNIKTRTLKRLINKVGEELFDKFLMFKYADAVAHSFFGRDEMLEAISDVKEKYKKIILEKHVMTLSKLAVDGRDMIALGLKDRDIGKALNLCLEHVLDNNDNNNKDILLDLVKEKFYNDKKE